MDVSVAEHAYRSLAERYLEKLDGVVMDNIKFKVDNRAKLK